jgi:hypothetical protein
MAAIGISPCPPFQHNNIVPGILYDGNTVAWYKHNDPVAGVDIQVAGNVRHWFDKYNYSLGAELINQAAWYTLAYWNGGIDASWSQVGNTLVCDGTTADSFYRLNIWTIGKTYKVTISVIYNAGNMAFGGDNSGKYAYSNVNATATFTGYITTSQTFIQNFSGNFNGTITAMSVKEVAGKHLIQQTTAWQPTFSAANGLLFDGVDDFMQCTSFVFIQPHMIYFVGKQITWTNTNKIFDGNAADTMLIAQWNISPVIILYSGAFLANNNNFILNTFAIVRALFNGANSFSQVNKTAAVVGDAGIAVASGFTLGASGLPTVGFSHIEVKEIILRKTADNANTQDAIYNYLKNVNGV